MVEARDDEIEVRDQDHEKLVLGESYDADTVDKIKALAKKKFDHYK